MLKATFALSFMAAVCVALMLTMCEQSTPIYEAPTYTLERLHRGHAYAMDTGLTSEDCADYLRHYPDSYTCTREAARPIN